METNSLSKDMVDLAMRIKKHLRREHSVSIALADPNLLSKLVELKELKDPVLQAMIQYMMALAGPDWSSKYANQNIQKGQFRGNPIMTGGKKESSAPAPKTAQPEQKEEAPKKPVRYYRGQPIYD